MDTFIIENFNFEKYHGLGNDYIIVNDILYNIPEEFKPIFAKKLCKPHFSIGADGLIFVNTSEKYDVKMRIFNNDGTEAEMCGNGVRCFSKYVYEKEICKKSTIDIETLKGLIKAKLKFSNNNEVVVTSVEIDMGTPILTCEKIPVICDENTYQCINETIVAVDKIFRFSAISIGNPHAIIFVDEQLNDNDLTLY
jgi:diaminopimelate epimerase